MILVTGPTGSGKTTTLYSLLQQMLTETESIFTIEDPVEYRLTGITQVGVNEATNMTFPTVLRSVLRQDPDIIMVGEIRDLDTAEIAVRSALTGHLVLSTIHTNDTVATITRLLDIGLDAYLVSSAVTGILAQRLVRRICPECKSKTNPPDILGRSNFPSLNAYYKGKGCQSCQYTGYRGQVGIYEFLNMDTRMRRLIGKNVSIDELWDAAKESGVMTLFENAWAMVENGTTTVDEVLMKIPYKDMGHEFKKQEVIPKARVLVLNIPEEDSIIINMILEPEGYEVTNATGDNIVKAINTVDPNLILMREFPGWIEAVEKLRSVIRYVHTPIVLLLDDHVSVNREKCIELGIKGTLSRPIDPQLLLDLL
jgi:DNA-binding NarL/FixJ family response regulator/nucleoside-triphosphatase THEP1